VPDFWLAIVLVITALVLSRSIGNDFVLDDRYGVPLNRYIGTWHFVWKSMVSDQWWVLDPSHLPQSQDYRPLQNVVWAFIFLLFGRSPAGWHAALIPFHLIVVWMVYRVGSLLAADRWTGVIAAALFALMPIHAQAVVWPSAMAFPLSAAFELGAFEIFLRGDGRPQQMAISLALFAGALLSCDTAVTFPGLIAAYALIFARPTRNGSQAIGIGRTQGTAVSASGTAGRNAAPTVSERVRDAMIAMLPYALVAAAYFVLRFYVLGFISRSNPLNPRIFSPFEVALTFPSVLSTDLLLLAIPWWAAPAHGLEIVSSIISSEFVFSAGFLAILSIAGLIALWRNSHRRLYLFCAAWLLISLSPMFNLNGLFAGAAIQDRYLYLPSFAFCLMIADLAVSYARISEFRAKIVTVGITALAVAYAVGLFVAQGYWHDEVSLWRRVIAVVPNRAGGHALLAAALEAQGDLTGAREQYQNAAFIDPDSESNSLHDLSRVNTKLGDRIGAANAMARWVVRLKNPSPDAYAELALAADAAGDTKGAENALAKAASMPGGADTAVLTRAQILFIRGDRKGAEDALRDLLAREPNNKQALLDLGIVLSLGTGHAPNIHYRLALILHRLGRDREARDECELALKDVPDNPDARALRAELEGASARH